MEQDVLFKKTLFGGFNREEVINYIQKQKKEQVMYKAQYEKQFKDAAEMIEDNKKLCSSLTELKNKAETQNEKINALNEENAGLKKEADELKIKIGELKESLRLAETSKNSNDDSYATADKAVQQLKISVKVEIRKVINKINEGKEISDVEINDMLESIIRELT